jgi:hypothetical protein
MVHIFNIIYIYVYNILCCILWKHCTVVRGVFFDLCWVFHSRNSPTSSTKVQESLLRCKPGRGRSRRTNLMIWVGKYHIIIHEYHHIFHISHIIIYEYHHISHIISTQTNILVGSCSTQTMAIEYNRITRNCLAIFWWTQDPWTPWTLDFRCCPLPRTRRPRSKPWPQRWLRKWRRPFGHEPKVQTNHCI